MESVKCELGLAPMEGITEFPARVWFYLISAPDFLSTPFLRLTESFPKYQIPPAWCPEILVPELVELIPYRCIPQFMTPNPTFFVTSAEKLLQGASFVDLNCGCPAPKAVGKGAGSSLLIDVDRFYRFISSIVGGIGPQQLSVKMRLGYHDTANFSELISALKELGLRRVSIHGRTRDQGYLGTASWDFVYQAAKSLGYPVVGSGDIVDHKTFAERLTGYDQPIHGAMIGRGALRNPWIFTELRQGMPISVEFRLLPLVLGTFALLNQWSQIDFVKLVGAVGRLMTASYPEDPFARWRLIYAELVQTLYGRYMPPEALNIDRGSMGRLKLHWGYMRTSLPNIFFYPPLMRAKTFTEFLGGIAERAKEYQQLTGFTYYQPQADPSYNWMFSGERRIH